MTGENSWTVERSLEHALQLSQEKFEIVFNACPSAMALRTLQDLRYVDANQAWFQCTGYTREEIIGRTADELDLIDNFLLWQQKNGSEKSGTGEVNFRTKSGEIRTGVWMFTVIQLGADEFVLTSLMDITDKKRLEQEMDKLDRLNLIGELAASIGHEVRNPMTTVRGFLQLFLARDKYPAEKENFEVMINELDRANAIITEFLSLARNRSIQLAKNNLNDIIRNMYPLLAADALLRSHAIVLELGDIPAFGLDANDIRQLLLNLCRNGLEAMQANGKVTIKTYADNRVVVLEVQDEGSGIPRELIGKLGTPFLTTKENGTGLGLPICYRIAKRHNAVIEFETGSRGTLFSIRFKLSDVY
jgi:PAS domain S-box-containing protein